MSSPNGSISAHQQRSSLNGIQRDHELSSHHSGEDTEIDMNGQDGMELERDDREVRDETRQHKLALGGGNRHREGDIGLGISNHLDSDDLPSPYLRTQFPSHSHRSHYTPSQTDTARMKDTPSSRPIASPIKSGRSSSPAHSIPPASPLQAHIAPAAAAPPSKPRYAQATPNHDSPRRPYNAYTPGQSSSLPIANIATTNGAQAGSRVVREDRAGEVLPTRKELGSLWKRDIPAEPSLEEAGLGEDVEMKEDKEDMELDELESETDKGNIVPAVASAAAVPKPRSARASRNRKPGKNAAGKKDKDKAKTKDVQEDKENLDVRLGDKESKGEFAYEYVAVTQVSRRFFWLEI